MPEANRRPRALKTSSHAAGGQPVPVFSKRGQRNHSRRRFRLGFPVTIDQEIGKRGAGGGVKQ